MSYDGDTGNDILNIKLFFFPFAVFFEKHLSLFTCRRKVCSKGWAGVGRGAVRLLRGPSGLAFGTIFTVNTSSAPATTQYHVSTGSSTDVSR